MQGMQRRQPALANALARYNDLCARLKDLLPEGSTFPLPQPLSTELAKLKDDPALLEDVWMSGDVGASPAWLTDADVRRAIRAMHICDRCAEESKRLDVEASSLQTWMVGQIRVLDSALQDPDSAYIAARSSAA